MALFKRLRDLTMASINDLLDKAEDPVKMLNQFLRDMEADIQEAESGVAKQIAVEMRFKQQFEEVEVLVQRRTEQAMKALEQGNEDLARRALEDKKNHQTRYDELKNHYSTAKGNADLLRGQLSEMKDEYNKLSNKKDLLVARAEAAKAQKHINQAMSGFGSKSASSGFDRMSEKVLQMEAEAKANASLRENNKTLEDELSSLGASKEVEEELEALKAMLAAKKEE